MILRGAAEDVIGVTAILGHDLKSPISIIISTLEVLISINADDDETSSNMRLLRGALAAAHRQMNMVNDLLDLARLEAGVYELERHSADMAQLISECMDAESLLLAAKRIRVEINLPAPNTGPVASVDRALMYRICSALVDNVLKFTVHDDYLRVSVKAEDGYAVVTFTDNGRLIHAGYEQMILEQAPNWDKRQAGTRTSVAMGLPFAYAAVLAQGGTMTAASNPQLGETTFTLSFPAILAAN
jgi:two-component system sensor histidine kinase KdpD